jgi:hypothetical protein
MIIQVVAAGLLLLAGFAGTSRWRRKKSRAKRHRARTQRVRAEIKHNPIATWLHENSAKRLMEKRRYRSSSKTDQTL